MKNIKILYFLLVILSSPLSNSGCPSFSEMVNRLDGIQSGTPLSVRTTNGESLEGVVDQILVDARTNRSYIVMRNSQGKQTSHWVSDLVPNTFKGPIDNIETESFIKFYSKGGNKYEGVYKGRKVIDGEDKFILEMPRANGAPGEVTTGYVTVSRVNENSLRIIESPMKQLSLPPNMLRPDGLELTSGQFISFQRGSDRLMARVKEIKTGIAGERVTVEVLNREGKLVNVDLQGARVLSSVKTPSENSMRDFAPLFYSRSATPAPIIPRVPSARANTNVLPPKIPEVADASQRLPKPRTQQRQAPGLSSRNTSNPPKVLTPQTRQKYF